MNEPSRPLIYRCEDRIATLHFNRPAVLNAIDAATAQAFLEACRVVAGNPEVRVVVLSGEGRAFVAGGDLKQLQADPPAIAATLIDPMHEGIMLLASLGAPVIASLKGVVAGAGMGLALACDLAICAEGTRFNFAYLNVGTSCDTSASWTLPRVLGLRRALEVALLNETLDSTEAFRLGMVNRVVPAERLDAETASLARRLALGPPLAMAHMKRLLRSSFGRSLEQQLLDERQSFSECASSQDFAEAIDAFFEKRAPRYLGR